MERFQATLFYLDATEVRPQSSGCTAHYSVDTSLCLKPAGEPHPKAPLAVPGLPPPTLSFLMPLLFQAKASSPGAAGTDGPSRVWTSGQGRLMAPQCPGVQPSWGCPSAEGEGPV